MKHVRHIGAVLKRGLAVAVCLLTLTSCQTTGDPRSGGLVGWSEDKAKGRQAELEREDALARQNASTALARGQQLETSRSAVKGEVDSLRQHLDRLLAENEGLSDQLRRLIDQRQLSSDELTRLRSALASNAKAIASARAVRSHKAAASAQSLSTHTEGLNEQNRQLHREVLLLLSR